MRSRIELHPESESLVSEIICMLMQEFHSAPTIACKSCRRRSIFATRHRRATTFLRSTEEATNMSAAHSRHKARRATHADRIGADRANGFRRLLGIQENAGHGRIARRIGMRGISHTVHSGRAANRRHTSPNRGRNRWWIRRLPNSIDAAGGVQSGHTAGRAMAYRGIRAATAQMAGRQSFRNTGDVGLSCASRRAGRGPRPANTAGIVGIVRIASMQLTLARRAIAR